MNSSLPPFHALSYGWSNQLVSPPSKVLVALGFEADKIRPPSTCCCGELHKDSDSQKFQPNASGPSPPPPPACRGFPSSIDSSKARAAAWEATSAAYLIRPETNSQHQELVHLQWLLEWARFSDAFHLRNLVRVSRQMLERPNEGMGAAMATTPAGAGGNRESESEVAARECRQGLSRKCWDAAVGGGTTFASRTGGAAGCRVRSELEWLAKQPIKDNEPAGLKEE